MCWARSLCCLHAHANKGNNEDCTTEVPALHKRGCDVADKEDDDEEEEEEEEGEGEDDDEKSMICTLSRGV